MLQNEDATTQVILFCTYVTTGEVTSLEHELWNDTVELGARVAESLLAGAESAEVLDGLWDDIIEEVEVNAGRACCTIEYQYSRPA